MIGIGDAASAERYARFTGLPLELVRVDPDAIVHRALGLHTGPGWKQSRVLKNIPFRALIHNQFRTVNILGLV